jgi:hypothetical protein
VDLYVVAAIEDEREACVSPSRFRSSRATYNVAGRATATEAVRAPRFLAEPSCWGLSFYVFVVRMCAFQAKFTQDCTAEAVQVECELTGSRRRSGRGQLFLCCNYPTYQSKRLSDLSEENSSSC